MRVALVLTVLLAGCVERIPREELARPYYLADYWTELCGWARAVDGAGRTWAMRGCDGDDLRLASVREATPAELDALRAAFDALPPPSGARCDSGNAVAAMRHLVHATADGERRWGVCENERDSVAEPFGTALDRINKLTTDYL